MDAAAESSKKRKRHGGVEGTQAGAVSPAGKVHIQVEETPSGSLGPRLAAFSTVRPPVSTEFSVYADPNDPTAAEILAGETDRMEYYSDPQAHSGQACSYMIGSFDPSSSKLTVAAAPLHIMSTRVKALKNLAPIVSSTAAANAAARATLGTAFGTKKAQRAIKTAERNQIDPESMKHVQDHLFASIATNTAALPTKEEVQASADALRPIPPFKLDAKAPKDVYELSGIVSSAELKAVPIDRLMKASQPDDAIALLPFRCEWIRVRIEKTWRAHPNGKLDKKELKKLKMLVYLSYLMAARAHGTTWFFGGLKGALTVGDRGRKKKKVKKEEDAAEEPATQDEPEEGAKRPVVVHCPDNVVEGLLSRFTETPQGSTKALVTSFYSMKLLSYIAALCLLYDDCACALGSLASDLQMDRKKLQEIFKSLGCSIEKPSSADLAAQVELAKAAGRSGLEAMQDRTARLKVPLQFPVPKRGKKQR